MFYYHVFLQINRFCTDKYAKSSEELKKMLMRRSTFARN